MPLTDPALIASIDPDWAYTAVEAGRLFGVHPSQLARWVARGHLAPFRTSKTLKFWGSELVRLAGERDARVRALAGDGVLVVARSLNGKLGRVAVTLAARQSCPAGCAFRGAGCYAEHDNNRVHWDRLTDGAAGRSPLDLARAEAAGIDGLPADRDLRLHVAGDSVDPEGTRLIAAAADRYAARGSVPTRVVPGRRKWERTVLAGPYRPPRVWAYTHGWRAVPRAAWGGVSVLASCETAADVALARSRGYAAALAVPAFASDRAYDAGGVRVVPCPQQTRGRSCTACRLCFDDRRLHAAGLAIGFALHGGGTNKAKAALGRLALPMAA